jgi:NDP-sugar pyrophosphorylase family protein
MKISKVPAIILLGGQGTRMENLAYKHILPSKQWLPIGFDENLEVIPLFWKSFSVLIKTGVKKFYIIVPPREIQKILKFFKHKLGEKADIKMINRKSFSEIDSIQENQDKLQLFFVRSLGKPTVQEILFLKRVLNTPFIVVCADDYFDEEETVLVEKVKEFIEESIEKIEKENKMSTYSFVKDEAILNKNIQERLLFNLNYGSQTKKFMITSLSVYSPRVFEEFVKNKNYHLGEEAQEFIEKGKGDGFVIDVRGFANVNTPEDYKSVLKRNFLNLDTQKFK